MSWQHGLGQLGDDLLCKWFWFLWFTLQSKLITPTGASNGCLVDRADRGGLLLCSSCDRLCRQTVYKSNLRLNYFAQQDLVQFVKYVNIYYLKNRKNEILKGSFREDELRLANTTDEVYPYTIVDKRKNKTLIHYDGFPSSEDEWIENKELAKRSQK